MDRKAYNAIEFFGSPDILMMSDISYVDMDHDEKIQRIELENVEPARGMYREDYYTEEHDSGPIFCAIYAVNHSDLSRWKLRGVVADGDDWGMHKIDLSLDPEISRRNDRHREFGGSGNERLPDVRLDYVTHIVIKQYAGQAEAYFAPRDIVSSKEYNDQIMVNIDPMTLEDIHNLRLSERIL